MISRLGSFLLLVVLCGGATFLTGCTARLLLYPVSGPVASQTPPPIFRGKITIGAKNRSGDFIATMANGETFQGRWRLTSAGPIDTSSPTDLGISWDAVYGPGYYVSHVLGVRQCMETTTTGSRATQLHLKICGDERGVAKDNAGNLYKVVFSVRGRNSDNLPTGL